MEPGVNICVLTGCAMPVALREVDGGHIHVGGYFVLGLMDGEGLASVQDDSKSKIAFEIV